MKKLLALLALASSMYGHAQLVPNGNSGSSTTAYTNGAPNDPIYIWCGTTLGAQQGSLTATPTNGTGPFTFNWYYHDQGTSSWQLLTTQTGTTSTISNLASDGYRVEIRDASNNITDCYIAWVWNLNTEVTASSSLSNCNNASLSSTTNTTGSFSYYNPPPPQSLINVNTQIQVCFSATHTYVSDLAFYLVGPPACGSPTILLSPNPGANGQNNVCNSGDNVNNLCFVTSGGGNLNVCNPAPSSLGGTYSTYGPGNTPINWSSLIGCNAAAGGWAVQIYDCIGADVGSLTNAQITFSNLTSICGSPTSISYGSGAINSAINDNSCTAASASIFQVPVSPTLSTPITINATTTLLWTSVPASGISNGTSANASAGGLPAGVTNFTMTATTSYGTTTCTSSASTSVNVIYPIVNAGPDQTVCSGQSVTLTGSGAATYSWDNGVTNGVPFVPGATATYTVVGTAANGCQASDQVLVTVNTTIPVNAGPDQAICIGQSATLTGSGAVIYTWNNGVVNGVPFSPTTTQTYTLNATDAFGCQGTDQVVVTVNPLPVVDAGPALSVCAGIPVTLNGSGAQTYTWNNGVVNGQPFTPTSTQTYTVTGTNSNGCSNTDQVTITISPSPIVNGGADQAVCQGGSVTLTATGAQTYSWSNGITNGVPFTPGSTTIYTVTGTAANGCQGNDQVVVTVNPIPAVDAGANQTICEGSQIALSGSGAATYVWSNSLPNNTNFTPPLGTNTYYVTGTSAAGCQNTDSIVITVILVPNSVLGNNTPLSGYPGLVVEFNNSSLYANSYDFNFGNNTNYHTSNISATPSSGYQIPGTYTVVLTASNGVCEDTSQLQVIVIPFPPIKVVMPNIFTPNGDGNNDVFFIRLENAISVEVTIVNRWGNKMATITGLDGFWDGRYNGNLVDDGVYFYNFTATGLDGMTTETGQGNVQVIR
ncbi:gliding motility-associated C-terminal domain-containing protein [Fluviicola sp.]|uniref:T9SS type B sorting domain-containing protein n=1 Tax=Fluviicola sp. TaxID=1917219 RepID=UPI002623995F|nr:gliding motility-associated C-terminal domain-containing protein [Fluviicola sp.]